MYTPFTRRSYVYVLVYPAYPGLLTPSAAPAKVNTECCPGRGGCSSGAPQTCSEECAAQWTPFAKACSEWLKSQGADSPLLGVTETCEREEYGRYRAGNKSRGRHCHVD